MTAAVVTAAAVVSAAVAFAMVMVTGGRVSGDQRARQQFCHPLICVAAAAGIESDPRLGQCHLSTSPDTAADQAVHLMRRQETR